MKRIVLAVAALAAALLAVPAPASANAFGLCEATETAFTRELPVVREELGYERDYEITAHPLSPDPSQPATTTECKVMALDPHTGELGSQVSAEDTVLGPVGFIRTGLTFRTAVWGLDFYICTKVWTSPVRVERDYGCSYAFTY